jgi:hypothetical protein
LKQHWFKRLVGSHAARRDNRETWLKSDVHCLTNMGQVTRYNYYTFISFSGRQTLTESDTRKSFVTPVVTTFHIKVGRHIIIFNRSARINLNNRLTVRSLTEHSFLCFWNGLLRLQLSLISSNCHLSKARAPYPDWMCLRFTLMVSSYCLRSQRYSETASHESWYLTAAVNT